MKNTVGELLEPRIKKTQLFLLKAETAKNQLVEYACIAGQFLNELKDSTPHGQFEDRMAQWFPSHEVRTLERWMKVATVVIARLQPPVDAESIADILAENDETLDGEALIFKQQFKEHIAGRTLKEIGEACAGEREPLSAQRAINGRTKGGTGSSIVADRKDFTRFAAKNFLKGCTQLSFYSSYNQKQKLEAQRLIEAMILGGDVVLMRDGINAGWDFSAKSRSLPEKFRGPGGMWPKELCEVAMSALRKRLKQLEQPNDDK